MNNLKTDPTTRKQRPSSLLLDKSLPSLSSLQSMDSFSSIGLPTPTSPCCRDFVKDSTEYPSSPPLEKKATELTSTAAKPSFQPFPFTHKHSKPLRHERSQSVIDYSTQFPNTWACSQTRILEPLHKFDEAMVWMQQNSRLSTENQRLQKALDDERSCTIRLAETLAQTELELEAVTAATVSAASEEKIKTETETETEKKECGLLTATEVEEMLRQVRAVERRRWSEIVERLERQVNQLRTDHKKLK
ncbi:hypothetical protein F4703DRAFT_1089887 [Phycomyces blakesleeanus]